MPQTHKDFYEIPWGRRQRERDEIKKAYRPACQEIPIPTPTPGISPPKTDSRSLEAYDVLSDPQKRASTTR